MLNNKTELRWSVFFPGLAVIPKKSLQFQMKKFTCAKTYSKRGYLLNLKTPRMLLGRC